MDKTELIAFLFLLARFLHVLAAAILVGGTLFYELIVPVAIDEMKDEQKLWIFARARWAFRWIVWCGVIVLILSGAVGAYRNWYAYNGVESSAISQPGAPPTDAHQLQIQGPGLWWAAHVGFAVLGISIAISLVNVRKPPRYPLLGMRITLLILMVAIFLASTTRHLRLRLVESHLPVLAAED